MTDYDDAVILILKLNKYFLLIFVLHAVVSVRRKMYVIHVRNSICFFAIVKLSE